VILAADVGGTKTHLALYEPDAGPRHPVFDRLVSSRAYPSLDAIVREFVDDAGARTVRGAVGVAGPVVGRRCDTTNLPWDVSADGLGATLGGADITLLNDLEATAWGLAMLAPADLEPLAPGEPAHGNRVLVAAGTGLGVALLTWDGRGWIPSASEGGHAAFAPTDPLEAELLAWMHRRHRRVSVERLLSGPGIADLYRFLAATGRGDAPAGFDAHVEAAPDPAVVVTHAALEGACGRARLALERFVRVYGAVAGDLALITLARGGVYLAGGIAPRILPFLREGAFLEAFRDKGRLAPVVARIPVSVVLRPETALWGAAAFALARAREEAS
jgi:glucokinase